MKNIKKIVKLTSFMLIMIFISSLSPFADDVEHHVIKISPNTWINAMDSVYNKYLYYRYMFDIPSDGYIRLETKENYVSVSGSLDWYDINYHVIGSVDPNESKLIAVDKGTYYILTWPDTEKAICQMKYTFYPLKATANYCVKKAESLKAGKTVMIGMSLNNKYSRWYKIKLTKKKRITVWTSNGEKLKVYNSKLERIEFKQAGSKSTKYQTKKQKKGTYYIRIVPYPYNTKKLPIYVRDNEVITLKWG